MTDEAGNIVDLKKAIIQPIKSGVLVKKNIEADVLRLDLIHPVISGNRRSIGSGGSAGNIGVRGAGSTELPLINQ